MFRSILAILISLIYTVPAFAHNASKSDGSTPIIIFRNHAERTNEVVYTKSENIKGDLDDAYDFVMVGGDGVASNYLNGGSALLYSPPVPPIVPNLLSFILALRADSSFTATQRMAMAGMLGLIQMDLYNPKALQEDWVSAIEAFGDTWLDKEAQEKILKHADESNIKLIP